MNGLAEGTPLAPVQPFWSDDFDMDLPKIFPEAHHLLGDLAGVEMWTGGSADANGRLNHPSCWNTDVGLAAFFGFSDTGRDEGFYVASGGRVRCTAWEAFRDAWCRNYVMVIENRVVWRTDRLWPHFETIMWNVRSWDDGSKKPNDGFARRQALGSYRHAIQLFREVVELHRARSAP
ncbi:hypothetical protein ACE10Z_23530 [Bradyrhizobium sp. Pha-3]|uniref:hypothetical protein n=1 Tax=Bradyrhizobium sp. Pha-3 TaxID=208375 RepID=UPI0035D50820